MSLRQVLIGRGCSRLIRAHAAATMLRKLGYVDSELQLMSAADSVLRDASTLVKGVEVGSEGGSSEESKGEDS